jgi:hypothetical protein
MIPSADASGPYYLRGQVVSFPAFPADFPGAVLSPRKKLYSASLLAFLSVSEHDRNLSGNSLAAVSKLH